MRRAWIGLVFCLCLVLLTAVPAYASDGEPQSDLPILAVNPEDACEPMEWERLSVVLSNQASQEHILGMPEPFILLEFGGGSDLRDGSHNCTPGASCSYGDPHCACRTWCADYVPGYLHGGCAAARTLSCMNLPTPHLRAACMATIWTSCYVPGYCADLRRTCQQNC